MEKSSRIQLAGVFQEDHGWNDPLELLEVAEARQVQGDHRWDDLLELLEGAQGLSVWQSRAATQTKLFFKQTEIAFSSGARYDGISIYQFSVVLSRSAEWIRRQNGLR